MPNYEVRLESQTDAQHRIVTLAAPSAALAREHAERQEHALADFSLLPPARETWEQPPGSADDANGLVDLGRWDAYDPQFARHAATLPYPEAVRAASDRLAAIGRRIDVGRDGKVKASDLSNRAKARYLAHHQLEPYAVVDVRQTDDTVDHALVASLVRLHQRPDAWEKLLTELRDQGVPLNAVTAALYGLPWQKQLDGSSTQVWSSATVQVSLHTAYTANYDTEDFFNDVSATEITGTGYTANGATLGSKASTYDTASDQIRLDGADTSWASSTLSATDAVIWINTAGASTTDPILGNVDFGGTVSTTAGTFSIAWDATGILVFDVT